MKALIRISRIAVVFLCLFPVFTGSSYAQGRVVINEFMPWTPSACGASAEFIELLNFGPGPVNIGCYIVTDGDYAITIPANTIIQPGEFFVLSGMDVIAYPCANIDSTIHSDLNWTTCGCTSAPIPATGDGFLTDGGSANEQVVLMDPNLNIVDAVVRSLPVEPSSLITTSTAGLGCPPKIFDLDLLTINYETIGESAGRGNSFARRLDGDCGWVKDPQQSGNATNNTPGDVSDVNYNFYISGRACPANGSVAVTVSGPNLNQVFPMSYMLAFDSDHDGIFEITDTYTTGTVANPNMISISNLVPGTYRLTVASVKGCYLHTFPFVILDCFDPLGLNLVSFHINRNNNELRYQWLIDNPWELNDVILERSKDGILFTPLLNTNPPPGLTGRWDYRNKLRDEEAEYFFFRLVLVAKDGSRSFSPVVNISGSMKQETRIWPNPVSEQLHVSFRTFTPGKTEAIIYNMKGSVVYKNSYSLTAGNNLFIIPVQKLSPGMYRLVLQTGSPAYTTSNFRFIR